MPLSERLHRALVENAANLANDHLGPLREAARQPDALQVTQGADKIGTHNKTPNSSRKWCRACGGHLFTEHPALNLVDVYAAAIPGFPFKPGVHVHYRESVLRITDGLPKWKDLPKEMRGSGEAMVD